MVKLVGAGRTDVGLKRSNNEDSWFLDNDLGLYIVADGMGGAASGELASKMVVETIADYVRHYVRQAREDDQRFDYHDRKLSDRANTLMQAIHLANRLVFNAAHNHDAHQGMGSTLAALMCDEGDVLVANVGDSRIFRSRGPQFVRLTVDHRLADDPKMKGVIDPTATFMETMGHTLTRAMGVAEVVDADLTRLPVEEGDLYLLCSDGLTDMVNEDMIAKVLAMDRALEQKATDLVDLALAGGGVDNVTALLVGAGPSGLLKGLFSKFTRSG
jgi:protein phosphatase